MVFLLYGWISPIQAQKQSGYSYVSKMMTRIPDSLTKTTDGIASFINDKFSADKEKSRAIFVWIARNIEYNFDSILTNSIYETPAEVSERILRTRTGVCLNFAHLFNELSNKSGIKSYVIHGYTKQSGRIDFLPHVWCASYIDTTWYLFDPTWGSGYVSRGRYIKQINGFYFMASPQKFIRSHMPFDPLWQFLNYPITHHEFKRGRYRPDTTQAIFNFIDTLDRWENSSDLERAISSAIRIEKCGVTNRFVEAKLRVAKGDIEYLSNKSAAGKYELAVSKYNDGIRMLNRFIGFKNERNTDSLMLTSLLDSTEIYFNTAVGILNQAGGVDENIVKSINNLKKEIAGTQMVLDLQRATLIGEYRKGKPPVTQ